MTRIQITTEYQPLCDCGNTYGDAINNEAEALRFIREFPTCSQCEVDQ
ncbi:hypothetical protein ACFFON_15360 [Arthrobacter citreus]|nr:hypothetical protein [Arthrobacter gandavensis]